MKCDEIIEKIKQADDDYRHRFVPIHLDLEIEDVLAAFYELKDKIQQKDFFWEGCGFSKMGFKNTIDVANYVEKLKAENIELQSFYDLHGNVDNYIDKLKAENEKIKDAQRWRKFPDEKPKWGEEVLVLDKEGDPHIVRFSHDMKWISWGKMNTCESDCIVSWMPLPKDQ